MIWEIEKFINRRLVREMDDVDITLEELRIKKTKGAIVVDVRSKQEYREGHIEGAISIPEFDITKKAQQILRNRDDVIVLYCTSGIRSKKAYKKLTKMGYKNVYNLYHGLENY